LEQNNVSKPTRITSPLNKIICDLILVLYFLANPSQKITTPMVTMENWTSVNMLKNDLENRKASVICELFAISHNNSNKPTDATLPTRIIGRCRVFIF
jgi:hypothetical protein